MIIDTGETGAMPADNQPLADAHQAIDPRQWRELHAHVVELQTQLAFQEDALQALDDVVTSQQRSIDRLMQFQRRLERQLAELAGTAESVPADQRPPHY